MEYDQKKIEELIAAGGAKCKLCGQRMLAADGCTCSEVIAGGKRYKRIKYGQIATLSNAPCAAASSSAVTAVRSTHSNGFKSVKNNGVRRKLCGKSADMGENVMIMILPEVLIVGPAADRIEQTDTGGIERYGIV